MSKFTEENSQREHAWPLQKTSRIFQTESVRV